jgi:hypothetical protein
VHASSLRVEPTRARNDALWADLGSAADPPAKRRRATPVSGARHRASHAQVLSRAIGGRWLGSRTPSRVMIGPLWTREPRPRRGPQLHQPLDQRSMAQPSLFL